MLRGRNVLVFDLDGTLVDSAPDLGRGLNAVLAEEGRPPLSIPVIRELVGDGVTALVERALARTGRPVPAGALAGLVERFVLHYSAGRHSLTRPYPGVVETLAELQARGYQLAICTNKPIELTLGLLRALELAPLFAAVTGGDSLPMRKPDPGHFTGTLELIGAQPAAAVMIGDGANDVAVARAAGVPAVIVSYGYSRVAPAELGADLLIDAIADLLPWLDQSPRSSAGP